ncbi:hypothetical protein [Pseudoxanthomonas winnipegensis]|uniref:hypothetical protein n=1 Tax=Pseudoxanthomonas winnipegensis TaxID=2480810 RepID=UPI003F825D7E
MQPTIVRTAALLACLLCLPALAQTPAPGSEGWNPADIAQAKAQADRDEASLPPDLSQAMRTAQQDTLERGVAACASPKADTTPFVIVARLDARGGIARTWRKGDTPLAICLDRFLRGRVLLAPPRAPFFVSFELSFTP